MKGRDFADFKQSADEVQKAGGVQECLAPSASPAFDISEYREELQALDVPDDQAAEMLSILWDIMRSFVELGFGVDSVSAVLPEAFGESQKKPSEAKARTIKCMPTDKILSEKPAVDFAGDRDSKE